MRHFRWQASAKPALKLLIYRPLVLCLLMACSASAQRRLQSGEPGALPGSENRFQSRPVAMGSRGAASTPHPLATQAAIRILQQGGNAVDAAVAAAAVAAVVQPFTSGMGGVGYASMYNARDRRVRILDFSGRTPGDVTVAMFPSVAGRVDLRRLEKRRKNLLGSLTPGVVAGWEAMLKTEGTISLEQALRPAIHLAEGGFPVSYLLSRTMSSQKRRLSKWRDSGRIFLKQGKAYAPGEILKQPELAASLRIVARGGSEAFYRGELATRLAAYFKRNGGKLSRGDLAAYKPSWLEPLTCRYHGFTIYGSPPPGSDGVFFEALNILSLFPEKANGFASAAYVHRSVEATKLARSDRIHYFGDPGFVPAIPVQRLLSLNYARRQKERIHPDRAMRGDPDPLPSGSHTIQLCTVDGQGNAVNLLQTVGMPFGNAVVAGDTGIVLNSMLYFSPTGDKLPNVIQGGKRIEMNPLTIIVLDREGHLRLMLGSPGGKTVIQTVRQMLLNVIDFGMNIQEAVDAPRFLSRPDGISVSLEAPLLRINPGLKEQLEKLGHRVSVIPSRLGSGQGIFVDALSKTRMAGSDFRMESFSLAY